jgi:glycosyltransferase involved in cell wall biosynthesis
MHSKKKVFFWSPMLSHVGTINAVEKSAYSLKKYLNHDVYLINVFGEFDYLQNDKNFFILNIFTFRKWPKTGLISKIIIYMFTAISVFKLIYFYKKYRPDIIISNLVGYLPNVLKYLYPKLITINSIQGLPKFNFLRKRIWKLFYSKSNSILTMTNITKTNILNNINYKNKILKVENPIISRKIRKLSEKKIEKEEIKLFERITFCALGRLTRQKNFLDIIKAVNIIPKEFHLKFNVIIIGSGEDNDYLRSYIKKNKIQNIFLLGFKNNPYPYIKHSDYFISSSLWEEPGHAILEAAYLNKLIISTDCPNGPKEILKNNFNSITYKTKNYYELAKIMEEVLKNKIKDEFRIKINMKKIVKNYTMLKFSKKIQSIIG